MNVFAPVSVYSCLTRTPSVASTDESTSCSMSYTILHLKPSMPNSSMIQSLCPCLGSLFSSRY
jgi:hypothetical protein